MNPIPPKAATNQTYPQPVNLAEARRAMSSLLPYLPEPRLSEWMTPYGITLPIYDVLGDPNALPILDSPGALLSGLGPYHVATLPQSWISAHEHYQKHLNRSAQLLRFHSACLRAETESGGIADLPVDGVVAGLLLLLVRPRSGALRAALVGSAVSSGHPFGAFLAARGMLLADEHARILESIVKDTRIASALCRRDPSAAGDLPVRLLTANDLWAATVALNHAGAEPWLRRVVGKAIEDPVAAVTALTLQPDADDTMQQRWLAVLLKSDPRFAYEAARWSSHTWAPARWRRLRDQLRERATSGWAFFHWYRDVQPELSAEALRNEDVEILWMAELVEATKNFGHALRRRCLLKLKSDPADAEAKLALRWLRQRGRPQ